MASITGIGSFGRARWLLGTWQRQLAAAEKDTAEPARTPLRSLRHRHWYPPRDPVFEQAAMAREMYRL